jgi:hypothetical protein
MTLSLQNQNTVPVYVKLAYTCTYNTYNLDTNVTVTDFIQNIKNSVYNDPIFNICSNIAIEVIEVGQYKKNSKPEEADPVANSDENVGLRFGKTPAFYVRLK